MRTRKSFLLFTIVALLFVAAVPLTAQVTAYDWSSAGVNGIVDPTSVARASSGPALTFSGSTTGTIVARYPVTNTYGGGQSTTPPWSIMWVTFVDNSALGSVIAKLYSVDKCANTQHMLCQVTSNDAGPFCSPCGLGDPFDFGNNSYYIEVTLNRTSSAATEQIDILALQ
jgi:hypothetical protein